MYCGCVKGGGMYILWVCEGWGVYCGCVRGGGIYIVWECMGNKCLNECVYCCSDTCCSMTL